MRKYSGKYFVDRNLSKPNFEETKWDTENKPYKN